MEDDPLFQDDDEANTPLTAEEREQLIPSYITLRHELNEAEQVNIGEGLRWAMSRRRDVLDHEFLNELHRRMFGEVWRWAGQYRMTARNIGVDAYRIAVDVRQTVDDVRYWVEHGAYPSDEIAVRFSHRLVAIHPFPNGNGRFSRLVGDLLARQLGRPPFSWGWANLVDAGETRARYVAALRAADNHEIEPLLAFARS
ncbi:MULTISPECIES: mobile mystery protein B [unclassified Mesorhizobium]|uniref:mobile mystery protein B n=1 Tax=unclassified Mesorhizobium TaxID=325217 RepID=UPI000FE9124A|nr:MULTISPECIES: mobile mystery protein B [unclassified Mesorhizobium]RWB98686.1 MAG: mobile mystery protein B [Mesorhizobium sp.]TGV21942.1 mobile mystery protein B [Mesorhizobium sp. M4B.F.Ca.ET.143.01.1.1]TIU21576.1 MAG: mobile mystery protein B [Mesorhizobium sp.]